MKYLLRAKSDSVIEVTRLYKRFELLPNQFNYEKRYPNRDGAYRKVVTINFRWLLWEYKILIRRN